MGKATKSPLTKSLKAERQRLLEQIEWWEQKYKRDPDFFQLVPNAEARYYGMLCRLGFIHLVAHGMLQINAWPLYVQASMHEDDKLVLEHIPGATDL